MVHKLLIWISSFILILSACKSSTNDPTEQEIRIEYLNSHTSEISIDPGNNDFTDLERLGNAIGNAQIVTLGEATHGEGNVFQAKTRIVKYLVQEHGYSVFALESPFYGAHKLMSEIENGAEPRAGLEKTILSVWSESAEFVPMLDLLANWVDAGKVNFGGFDPDFGSFASESMVSDLKSVLAQKGFNMHGTEWDLFETLLQELADKNWLDISISQQDKNTFDQVLGDVDSVLNTNISTEEDAFWVQMTSSIQAEAERKWIEKSGGPGNGTGGLRDLQMGENVLWLKQVLYPNEKIILWAANIHNARTMSTVTAPEDPDFSFDDFETMGKVVAQALGNDIYVISFTGLSGQWSRWFDSSPNQVTVSSMGSIEFLLGETGHNNTFLDLRNPGQGGAWLHDRLRAKPMGYVELEANWNEVTDGFFFVRTITPATPK